MVFTLRWEQCCIVEIKINAWSRFLSSALQINLILIRYPVKRRLGKTNSQLKNRNFACNQWENTKIVEFKNQGIKQFLREIQKCTLWISRSSDRNYGYLYTKVPANQLPATSYQLPANQLPATSYQLPANELTSWVTKWLTH